MSPKKPTDYRALLRTGRWFRALPEAFQDALLRLATVRVLGPGTCLFARGDASLGMFGVIEGQLSASGTDEQGRRALLTIVEPPSWVGEIALFDGLPRTHDLIADTAATVVFVPQDPLLRFLDQEPRYWRDLALLLTSKLRLVFASLEQAQLLPISARVAQRLCLIAEGYGEWDDRHAREVRVSQDALATMLSTSRQTVNQVLRTFEGQGWLRVSYGRVEILDLDALRSSIPG